VLTRLLRKDPIERFPSARALEDAILSIPSWDAAIAPPAADAGDDTPTARPSAALLATFEQRVVTALFAGLPHHAGEAERRIFASIAEDQGGACHGTLGRRVIAVFGGARSTGDEAMRAARTALTAAERMPGIQLAIATGRALAGVAGLSG